jgi:hypothetical protein
MMRYSAVGTSAEAGEFVTAFAEHADAGGSTDALDRGLAWSRQARPTRSTGGLDRRSRGVAARLTLLPRGSRSGVVDILSVHE